MKSVNFCGNSSPFLKPGDSLPPEVEGIVRIQHQRGHTVISSGPYHFVRHPGYVGFMLTLTGLPLALGSYWALLPGAVGIAILCMRTRLEDTMLQRELPGYRDYTQRTPFRLLPGVW